MECLAAWLIIIIYISHKDILLEDWKFKVMYVC